MDGTHFDSIVRRLAGHTSRRSLLRAGMVAGISASLGLRHQRASAQDPCTTLADCGPGQLCEVGLCIDAAECEPSLTSCGAGCVDLQNDAGNCGSCGNFCGGVPGPGYSSVGECIGGQCVAVCLPEAAECSGECTDLNWDVRNCGSCGNRCSTDQICCAGGCVSRDSAERFCDFCGYQGGWPQGCNEDEVCSGGLCLAVVSDSSGGETSWQDPADTAYLLSVLESESDINQLYDRMHPDAQIAIPRGAVTYWYSQYFVSLGPQPIVVTGVEYTGWTWEVIGRTYPGTAVVRYEQSFANSSPVTEVVRLVQDGDGEWRWFFGRSEAFVEEMNGEAENTGLIDPDDPVTLASGLHSRLLFAEALSAIDSVSPSCFSADLLFEIAPQVLQGSEKQELMQSSNSASSSFSYLPVDRAAGDAYPDLIVIERALGSGETPETTIAAVEESIADWDGPEFTLPPRALEIDLAPASGYLVAYYEEYTEVMGHVPVITWGVRGGDSLFTVSGPAIVAANELLAGWADSVLPSSEICAV